MNLDMQVLRATSSQMNGPREQLLLSLLNNKMSTVQHSQTSNHTFAKHSSPNGASQWMLNNLLLTFVFLLLQNNSSRLKERVDSPRPFQSLLSRYQCNRAESCGEYPRKLEYITDPSCWFCGHPQESILHLLDDCPGTSAYPAQHSLSTSLLWCKKHHHPCSRWPTLTLGLKRPSPSTQCLQTTEFDQLCIL